MALIPWWINYPNVNDEIMNLDWLLRVSNENTEKISNFINLNTIKYADPILWDITSQYEANTITVDPQTGDAYISNKAVPYGVALSNTDYWTKIYNYADEINKLEEQIAAANERLSTTATAPRAKGDLVWLNGLLYEVTAPMIAGDSYVEGSNCAKTTINAQLLRLHQADTALGQRIDDEAEARADADTALGERIDNLDVNHVYNQSTPESGLTTNIGLKEGTYNITEDTVINAQLVIPKGAILNVSSGVTLTINGEILAGRYQIFEGSGTIVVNNEYQPFGYPEWFNDDVAKCYSVFRCVKLGLKRYTINGDLVMDKSNSIIEGVCYGTNWNTKCSELTFTNNGHIIIGTYATTTINEFPRNITIKNVFILNNTTSEPCISVYGVVRALIEKVYIQTSSSISGITFLRAIGSTCRDVYVQSVGISGTFYGYRFYDESNTGVIGARSTSVWLNNCTYSDTNSQSGNTRGFQIDPHHSDIYINSCEVAGANLGLVLNALSDSYCVDILISDCDFDSCRTNAILAIDCSNGCVSLNNCYGALTSNSTEGLIYCNNCTFTLLMNNIQLIGTNSNQSGFVSTGALKSLINNLAVNGIFNNAINIGTSTSVKYTCIANGTISSN